MSLNKAIQHGKERRKPYKGAKSFDHSCRNRGRCSWCLNGRLHKRRVSEFAAAEETKEWFNRGK